MPLVSLTHRCWSRHSEALSHAVGESDSQVRHCHMPCHMPLVCLTGAGHSEALPHGSSESDSQVLVTVRHCHMAVMSLTHRRW